MQLTARRDLHEPETGGAGPPVPRLVTVPFENTVLGVAGHVPYRYGHLRTEVTYVAFRRRVVRRSGQGQWLSSSGNKQRRHYGLSPGPALRRKERRTEPSGSTAVG